MNCLQCGKPATENGKEYKGVKLRECEDQHRTAIFTKTYKKPKKSYVKVYKHDIYDIPKTAA